MNKKQLIQSRLSEFHPLVALFDMDGVLYDSMPRHARSWHETMAFYGLAMSEEEAYACEGMRGVETIRLIARRQWGREVSDEEAQKMYAEKSRMYSSLGTAPLIPGILDVHRALRERGIHIGVVTGSGQATLLRRISEDFKATITPGLIVTANDVRHGKPSPEPYQQGLKKAAALLGFESIAPSEAIVIENAPLGVRSAVAAGCFTVAVNTGPLPDAALYDEGADVVFSDMHELAEAILG